MNIQSLVNQLKKHARYADSGMILIHNGVVRNNSRNGKRIKSLSITVDHSKVSQIINKQKKREGIIEILIHIIEGQNLKVGDDLMYLLVMGDIRDNVIPVLHDTLNEIKQYAATKTEDFIDFE